jgi:hypothetical protein
LLPRPDSWVQNVSIASFFAKNYRQTVVNARSSYDRLCFKTPAVRENVRNL